MIRFRPIRRILAATELSAATEDFLRNVGAFAKATNAELHVLSSLSEGPRVGIGAPTWLDTQKELHQRRIVLRDIVDQTVPDAASARVWLGQPAEVILDAARESEADVIVLGPHRQRGVGDRYLGSTAERVLGSAEVPCLLLNGSMSWPVRRILIPADFSAPSHRALRAGLTWVRMLSRRGPVEIDCVHVAPATHGGVDSQESMDGIRGELEKEIGAIREEAELKIPIHIHVLEGGEPIDELLRFATDRPADLVVMGTRGDSVFMRALLGSMTSVMLRRTTLPLLLVPPRAFADDEADQPQIGLPITAEPVIY